LVETGEARNPIGGSRLRVELSVEAHHVEMVGVRGVNELAPKLRSSRNDAIAVRSAGQLAEKALQRIALSICGYRDQRALAPRRDEPQDCVDRVDDLRVEVEDAPEEELPSRTSCASHDRSVAEIGIRRARVQDVTTRGRQLEEQRLVGGDGAEEFDELETPGFGQVVEKLFVELVECAPLTPKGVPEAHDAVSNPKNDGEGNTPPEQPDEIEGEDPKQWFAHGAREKGGDGRAEVRAAHRHQRANAIVLPKPNVGRQRRSGRDREARIESPRRMAHDVDRASALRRDGGDGLEDAGRALTNGRRRQGGDFGDDDPLAHPLERLGERPRDAAEVGDLAELAESKETGDEQNVMRRLLRIG
jgi:hypothetical protein